MSILRALRRQQTLALGVAILLTGICAPAAWFLVPAKYKAQARLQVMAQTPKVVFQTVETEGGDDYRRYQQTQITLVKSRLVLNAALTDEKVAKCRMVREQIDPISWLQGALTVEFVSGSEVMEISLMGDDNEELAVLVNAVKKAYMHEVVLYDVRKRSERHATLKSIQEKYKALLKERRDTQRKLAEAVGSNDPKTLSLRQQLAMEHLSRVKSELLDVRSEKRRAEAQLRVRHPAEDQPVASSPSPSVAEADVNRLIEQDPGVARLVAKLSGMKEKWESESSHMRTINRKGTADPGLKLLRDNYKATQTALASLRAQLRPMAIRQLQEQDVGDKVTRGGESEHELAYLDDLEQHLNKEIDALSKENRSETVKTLDLQSLQEESGQLQSAALKVGTEVEALNVELEAPPRIRTIEDAVPPRTLDQTKKFMLIAMISFGSFFGGLFGVAFLELQLQKVDSADEVPADLGLRVVGALPILPPRTNRGPAISRGAKDQLWQALMLESIDATRTMLVHAARTESHRVVMVASAVSGEGKTSLASHLATSLARSGLKTLLIDADLRSPAIHRIFDLPCSAGLSELLRGEVGIADVISDTAIGELKVITAGGCDQQTIRVLAQGALGGLFAQLKEQFDFVIVDSSPVLPVADALIVAQQADAVLFSIFRDVSRKTKVNAALRRLESLGVRILGAVVTGGQGGLYGNYYGGESTYYSKLPASAANSSSSDSST